MGLEHQKIEDMANRFFGAIEKGSLEDVISHYHPDVRIWHSRDEADTDVEQSKQLLTAFIERVPERRYEIVRRHIFDGGFVQEHVVHGTMADGSKMRLPVCFLCHVDDNGKITRIAEYLDSGKSPMRDIKQDHKPL